MASKKTDTLETLALELMRRIPRHAKVSKGELLAQIQGAGFERDERSIQRLLQALTQRFDIECDNTSRPYGYRWKPQGQTKPHGAETELPGITAALADTPTPQPPAAAPTGRWRAGQRDIGPVYNHWFEVDYLNQKDERQQTRVMPLGLAQQGPRLYLECRFDGYDNQRIRLQFDIDKGPSHHLLESPL